MRQIGWQKLGELMVPVRIATGDEVLTATWKRLDRQWAVPVQWRFERVFGADWGPETLRCTDIKK